jgi:TonB family protein
MRKIAPILLLVLSGAQFCVAQGYRNEKVIYLDNAGHPAKEKKAFMLEQIVQLDDTLWEMNFYLKNSPRFRTFRCSDPDGNMRNGQYITYDNGQADTIGYYYKGVRSGHWNIYGPKRRRVAQQLYENGLLLWTKDTTQLNRERDSLNALHKTDSTKTFTKVEIESEFPGGASAWLHFLNQNLRYPDNAVNNMIQGNVIVGFVVDTEGHIPVNSVWIDQSVEYSLDQAALHIIFISPAWTPANQNGRKVKSYKRQPINFRLEVQNRYMR